MAPKDEPRDVEREQTDESLRVEREKVDEALEEEGEGSTFAFTLPVDAAP